MTPFDGPSSPLEPQTGPDAYPTKRHTLWRLYRRNRQWADITAGFGLGLGTGLILAALIGALTL